MLNAFLMFTAHIEDWVGHVFAKHCLVPKEPQVS